VIIFNLKEGSIGVSYCGVCMESFAPTENICCENLEVIKNGKKTLVNVFFHERCIAEFLRRYPKKKEGSE